MQNYGLQNEFDFVELFNEKYLYELNDHSQEFLKELFNGKINNEEKIIAWKNKAMQKADIFIKYKNYVKAVSLKCGHNNSMHSESIQDFRQYLEALKIPYEIIEKYVGYHYGYLKDENGKSDYLKRLSAEEYTLLYPKETKIFNDYINKTKIIVEMIDRFVIRGKNSNYDIDALICGTTDDYVWIMKYDIYDLILSKRNMHYDTPHIGFMTIGPKIRNINFDNKNDRERYIVVIRWNNIQENIIEFHKKKKKKSFNISSKERQEL